MTHCCSGTHRDRSTPHRCAIFLRRILEGRPDRLSCYTDRSSRCEAHSPSLHPPCRATSAPARQTSAPTTFFSASSSPVEPLSTLLGPSRKPPLPTRFLPTPSGAWGGGCHHAWGEESKPNQPALHPRAASHGTLRAAKRRRNKAQQQGAATRRSLTPISAWRRCRAAAHPWLGVAPSRLPVRQPSPASLHFSPASAAQRKTD